MTVPPSIPAHGPAVAKPPAAVPSPEHPIPFLPARHSPRFFRFFAWYCRRLISKRFAAFRLTPGSAQAARDAARSPAPLMIALTHSSWWDPLIAVVLADALAPERPPIAPMEHEQLAKFRFMTRLGIFGIDPDHPAAIATTLDYLLTEYSRNPNTALWITPQGQFTDPRHPVRLRPGLAALAARLGVVPSAAPNTSVPPLTHNTPTVLTIAIELAFWVEQRPEIFARIESVVPPAANSTTSWHRAITDAMQSNADALASLVIARDPAAFHALPMTGSAPTTSDPTAPRTPRINPIYDRWLRLRGHDPAIRAKSRS